MTGIHFPIYYCTISTALPPLPHPTPASVATTYLHRFRRTQPANLLDVPPRAQQDVAAGDGHDVQEREDVGGAEEEEGGRGCGGGGEGGRVGRGRGRSVGGGDGAEGAGWGVVGRFVGHCGWVGREGEAECGIRAATRCGIGVVKSGRNSEMDYHVGVVGSLIG